MNKIVPIPALLLAGFLTACGAARPLPTSVGAGTERMLTVPSDAASEMPADGYPMDLPEALFESREDFSPEHVEGPHTSFSPDNRVLAIARQYLGIPYRKGGASPDGFDCSGLVYYTYRQMGITVPRTSASQHRAAQTIALNDLRPGDLLFFKIKPQRVSHVGIFVEGDLFLHATSTGKNVTYSRLGDPYWKKRLAGAGRFVVD